MPREPITRELQPLRLVTSGQNALVKELRKALNRAELTPDDCCGVESVRIVEEAIRSGLRLKAVFFSQSAQARAEKLLPQLSRHTETVLLPDEIFHSIVTTENPQGVAALVRMRRHTLEDTIKEDTLKPVDAPLVVVAAGIQDPGNLGTLVRSAEAFGAGGVLCTEGAVSQFNAKVVRASAGSLFRLPVVRVKAEDAITELRARGLRLLATTSHGGMPVGEAQLSGPVALFIGGEGAGLARGLARKLDGLIAIPHVESVESLNAGVAGSIVLYETARQRGALVELKS